jgi:hypothetical protein
VSSKKWLSPRLLEAIPPTPSLKKDSIIPLQPQESSQFKSMNAVMRREFLFSGSNLQIVRQEAEAAPVKMCCQSTINDQPRRGGALSTSFRPWVVENSSLFVYLQISADRRTDGG